MIRVTPPMIVVAKDLHGSLIEISATHARIDWEQSSDDTQVETITIQRHGVSPSKVDVVAAGQNLFRFKDNSLATIQDLMHALRKSQHLELCANSDIEHSSKDNGFSAVTLPVVSLPEISWNDLNTSTSFMNKICSAPVLITGMTGGVEQGTMINERLAHCAVTHNIPMGVGSQRMALENPSLAGIFRLKDKFPDLFLIGNIGIGQLCRSDFLDQCQRAVDMIQADALAIHVNVLQELIQVEGDRDFRGVIAKIGSVQEKLSVPVIVKEVGVGLDALTAKKLWEQGIRYFDVGGSGGTSWARIEGLRASNELIRRRGDIFRDWGMSTAESLLAVKRTLPQAEVVATGGIRDGLTVLKAVHSGAKMAGIGLPLMKAALEHDEAPTQLMSAIIDELKTAMMVSGLQL
jgi:isopentenyl-diphosphate delta-isomerase